MSDTYRTIDASGEGMFKDKGSRFLAYAYPLNDESEVKEIIDKLKKEHYSARHHCYAWRLGAKGEKFRANDDGEPSGTAGKPILGQLLSKDVTNILIVVVRYFGGTLLGVSGLINAYRESTIEVLNQTPIVEKIIEDIITLKYEYPLMNRVMKVVKDDDLTVIDTQYEMDCLLKVTVRQEKTDYVFGKFEKIEGVTTDLQKTVI